MERFVFSEFGSFETVNNNCFLDINKVPVFVILCTNFEFTQGS